jgi:hypothetical protein
MDSSCDLIGIDVPKALPVTAKGGVQVHDTLVGVDLAKAVLQLAVSSRPGRFDSHPRLTRDQFLPFFAQLPPAVVIVSFRQGCMKSDGPLAYGHEQEDGSWHDGDRMRRQAV